MKRINLDITVRVRKTLLGKLWHIVKNEERAYCGAELLGKEEKEKSIKAKDVCTTCRRNFLRRHSHVAGSH